MGSERRIDIFHVLEYNYIVLKATWIVAFLSIFCNRINSKELGFSFLNLDTGVRSAALGGAFVGISDDCQTIYHNPAGLGVIRYPELNFMHLSWIADINRGDISYVYPIKRHKGIGIGLNYLWTKMESVKGSFYVNNLVANFGYGQRISRNMFAGMNMKLIRESVSADSLSSFSAGFDLGLLVQKAEVSFGLVLRDIGITFQPLYKEKEEIPTKLKAGISYKHRKTIILTTDITSMLNGDIVLSIGAELNHWNFPREVLSLRLGYQYRPTYQDKDFLSGVRLGVGAKLYGIGLDYTVMPFENLGSIHYISLGMKFYRKVLSSKI